MRGESVGERINEKESAIEQEEDSLKDPRDGDSQLTLNPRSEQAAPCHAFYVSVQVVDRGKVRNCHYTLTAQDMQFDNVESN